MKKLAILMSYVLVAVLMVSCSNDSEELNDNGTPLLSQKEKEAMWDFCSELSGFTISMTPYLNTVQTRAGMGMSYENMLSERETEEIIAMTKSLDDNGKKLLKNIGFTEQELQALDIQDQPLAYTIAATQLVNVCAEEKLLDDPLAPMFPGLDGRDGREISAKEVGEYALDCVLEAFGINEISITSMAILETAQPGALKKLGIEIVKAVGRTLGKSAGIGWQVVALAMVVRWALCMKNKLDCHIYATY